MPNGRKAIDPRFARDVRSMPPNACSVRTQRRDKATRDQHEANKARSCSPMMPFLPCSGPPLRSSQQSHSRRGKGFWAGCLADKNCRNLGGPGQMRSGDWVSTEGGANSTPTSNQRRALCEIDTSLRRRQPKGVCRSGSPMAAREHGPPSRCLDDMRPAVGVGGRMGGGVPCVGAMYLGVSLPK